MGGGRMGLYEGDHRYQVVSGHEYTRSGKKGGWGIVRIWALGLYIAGKFKPIFIKVEGTNE